MKHLPEFVKIGKNYTTVQIENQGMGFNYPIFHMFCLRNIYIKQRQVMALLDTAKDFFCGCVSGWTQVIVQQPFELVKARLVNQSMLKPEYSGIIDCFNKIRSEEGLAAFYKGSLVPILGVGCHVSLQFGFNQLIKKIFMRLQNEDQMDSDIPTMQLVLLSGFLTGIPSAIAIAPIDHLKIQMQIQKGKNQQYHGSIDCGKQIYRKYGVKGLYLGFNITLLREVVALSEYFGIYEYAMRMFSPDGDDSSKTPMFASFLAGGMAGSLSWLFSYPIDYVKTVIQSQHLQNIKYQTALDCVTKKYHEEGIKTFFKGLGVTMLRSFPVNGTGFLVFQGMMRMTGRKASFSDYYQYDQYDM